MGPDVILPTKALYDPLRHRWTLTFNCYLLHQRGANDPAKWEFRRDGVFVTPDTATLSMGRALLGANAFDGSEIAVRYLGPPPTYYNRCSVALAAFDWFYYIPR